MRRKIDLKKKHLIIPLLDMHIEMGFWQRLKFLFLNKATGMKGRIFNIRGDCYIEDVGSKI